MPEKVITLVYLFGLSLSLIFSGCGASNATKGTGGDTGSIGTTIGNIESNGKVGLILRGEVGRIISQKMGEQKRELESEVPEASIEAINEGQALRLTFRNESLFASNSSALHDASRKALTRFVRSANTNPDTDISIVAHTDSSGSYDFNVKLSQERAQSVANFLQSMGLSTDRMTVFGMGPNEPIVDSSTPDNRAINRRLVILITPNAKMVSVAQERTIQKKNSVKLGREF